MTLEYLRGCCEIYNAIYHWKSDNQKKWAHHKTIKHILNQHLIELETMCEKGKKRNKKNKVKSV